MDSRRQTTQLEIPELLTPVQQLLRPQSYFRLQLKSLFFSRCHSRRKSASVIAPALVLAFPSCPCLSVLSLPSVLSLSLPFRLSFPKGICFCPGLSVSHFERYSALVFAFLRCHSRRESASLLAFLSLISEEIQHLSLLFFAVIPAGNLLLPWPFCLSFRKKFSTCLCFSSLSFPQGICFSPGLSVSHLERYSALVFAFLRCHSRRESASLWHFCLSFRKKFSTCLCFSSLSFPKGICFCPGLSVSHLERYSALALAFLRCHSRRKSASPTASRSTGGSSSLQATELSAQKKSHEGPRWPRAAPISKPGQTLQQAQTPSFRF
jgi:hypothetical protein